MTPDIILSSDRSALAAAYLFPGLTIKSAESGDLFEHAWHAGCECADNLLNAGYFGEVAR